MNEFRIVVAHHDEAIRAQARDLVTQAGWVPEVAKSWDQIVASAAEVPPEIVVTANELSGFDVLGRIDDLHKLGVRGLVVLVADDDHVSGPRALDAGADDYLPIDALSYDFVPRIRALHRLLSPAVPRRLEFGALTIDLAAYEVFFKDIEIEMTRREFELLVFLAMSPATTFTREELLQQVWHTSAEWQGAGTVTEHVRRLRQKLALHDTHHWIRTVRGIGYAFMP